MSPRSLDSALLGATVLGLAAACRSAPPDGGTSVGNPGGVRMAMGGVDGTVPSRARIAVAELVWTDCAGTGVRTTVVNSSVDLLDSPRLSAPPGAWCVLELVPAGPLELDLVGEAGGSAALVLALDLAAVESAKGFSVDEGVELALELGGDGWLSAAELGLSEGVSVSIAPGDPEHDGLASRARSTTGLYADDGDGQVSEAERGAGAVASAPPEDDDDDDDDEEDDDER